MGTNIELIHSALNPVVIVADVATASQDVQTNIHIEATQTKKDSSKS